ncbi:hypothetical protein ACFX13_010729 [Malus domestica]|uniref:Uncharacterized protein n=1 Tax=Malus domestica TaxID=3750 RepID=A0A498IJX5_MALDO|nr:hypothetical protein DVH24_036765 [Malus domestica]
MDAHRHGLRSCGFLIKAMAWYQFLGQLRKKNIDDNIGSLRVKLTKDDMKEISDMIPINAAAGERLTDSLMRCSWKFANTPAKQ